MEKIGEVSGVEFINDSKATNAESAYWALTAFDEIYWIMGGIAKEGGIESLAPLFKEDRIKRAFTIGECGREFYKAAKRDMDTWRCKKLDKAVAKAFKLALKDLKKGRVAKPVILLSPAAASFDQYNNFEERGEHFKQLFKGLKKLK
jgi:UDP-N-acetylmuramoylalanine--D-glutamate ligase